MLRRARYRIRQFTRGLRPHLAPHEVAEARLWLTPAEFALFRAADPRDRRHSMDLFLLLRREGTSRDAPPSDDILVAALIHDVGKGHLMTADRILFVILRATSAGLARWVAAEHGAPWRRAQWRLHHHAALGANVLRHAGSAPRVVEVVAEHTGAADAIRATDPELAWFIESDDRI